MIEQITGRTDNKLQRAVGKNAGLCNHPGGGKLLQQPPAGKIEGIDVDSGTVQGCRDMPTDESTAPGEMLDASIKQEGRVWQFPAAFCGVNEQGSDAAIDIDHIVGLGRPRQERQLVKLILSLRDVFCELLQQIRALMKSHST